MGGPGSGNRKGNPASNRVREEPTKTAVIYVRCTDAEKAYIAAIAEMLNMTISEYALSSMIDNVAGVDRPGVKK